MDAFRAVGDPIRRSLLTALAGGPARVVDLTRGRGISRPAVSRHLALLLEAGCVSATPQGRQTWYALKPQGLDPVRAFLDELPGAASPPGAAGLRPPLDEARLSGLDLEIRRTVRHDERERGAPAAATDEAREASA